MSEKLVLAWNWRDVQVCDPTLSQAAAQEILLASMADIKKTVVAQAYNVIDRKIEEHKNALGTKNHS